MAADKSGIENRKFRRARVNLSVIYRVDKPAKVRLTLGAKEFRSTMVDLSEGGISLLIDHDIPAGSQLMIKFTLFNLEKEDVSFYGPMEILGEVRYNIPLGGREYRIGILFRRLEEQDRREIVNFLNRIGPA